jgi:hypothetical protein
MIEPTAERLRQLFSPESTLETAKRRVRVTRTLVYEGPVDTLIRNFERALLDARGASASPTVNLSIACIEEFIEVVG